MTAPALAASLADPVFIVGSGRSGTAMMRKLLSRFSCIEAHHEYLATNIQKDTVRYSMGLLSEQEMLDRLEETHGAAVHYCPRHYWLDSSNLFSWLVAPAARLFPRAVFIHLVRDGRKVVSSFFHKLGKEMYDDRSVAVLSRWLDDPGKFPCPPPEKKYWRKIPRPGEAFFEEFPSFGQFERICYHWTASNAAALEGLAHIPDERNHFFQLERLVSEKEELTRLLAVFGVAYDEESFSLLQRPHNVAVPREFGLTAEEREQFAAICGPMMRRLGYDIEQKEYFINY